LNKSEQTKISKFLSYVLRHKPDAIGLQLDSNGWADIDELISKANDSGELEALSIEQLKEVVADSDKQRFIISDEDNKIRANQGHSIKIDLQLKGVTPPETLYHGTAERFMENINRDGLKPGERHHVHLSADIDTANAVGQRYGKPVILKIKALLMHQQGFKFFLSENGVWLTDKVPVEFIESI
jgi:putative RNA 2'-phosphotransferase